MGRENHDRFAAVKSGGRPVVYAVLGVLSTDYLDNDGWCRHRWEFGWIYYTTFLNNAFDVRLRVHWLEMGAAHVHRLAIWIIGVGLVVWGAAETDFECGSSTEYTNICEGTRQSLFNNGTSIILRLRWMVNISFCTVLMFVAAWWSANGISELRVKNTLTGKW